MQLVRTGVHSLLLPPQDTQQQGDRDGLQLSSSSRQLRQAAQQHRPLGGSGSHMSSLRYVLLLQRDVPRAARFYSEGLGLQLKVLTDRWAELESGGTTIALKAADGCGLWARGSLLFCAWVVF